MTDSSSSSNKNKAWSRLVVVWHTPEMEKKGKSRRKSMSLAVIPDRVGGTTEQMVGYMLNSLRKKYGRSVRVKDHYYEDGGSECFEFVQ